MESQEVLESRMAFHGSNNGVNGLESKKSENGMVVVENLEDFEFIDDFDTMMDEVDDRLRISRMVSDSIIKGIISAVEQEAEEKVKVKELEIESLKRASANVADVEVEGLAGLEGFRVKSDEMKEVATDEFKRLRKQIESVRGSKIKRNGSCHEMVGLGGILKDWYDLEKTVDGLEMMMKDMSDFVDSVLVFSETSVSECQHEKDLKGEVEDMVIQSSIKCIREEFEEAGRQNVVLAEKFGNISELRNELESLKKLLPSGDSGHLISHSSFDVENTRVNPLRSELSSRWEENGELSDCKPPVSDTFEANKFSHLNREELVQHFSNTISEKKRQHEAEMHELTDKYINLKGKYLSERRSLILPKDFEVLKRKIPAVVSKLDGILSESDEFIGKGDCVASLNIILKENRQLRDSLVAKTNEVKHLTSQLLAVSEENGKSLLADTFVEASTVEDVYKCVILELNCQIQEVKEESEQKVFALQDIYEVLMESATISAIKDTSMEFLFRQELLETVFKETITDVKQYFENMRKEYITTCENFVSLEKKATGMEVELILEAEEREKLTNEMHLLRNLMEEKETLARDELNNLRKQASWQETLMSKTNKELEDMSDELSKAREKLLSDKMEIDSLNQKLLLAMEEIKALNDYKNMVHDLSQEKHGFASLLEAKEKEHRKQMEAVVVLVDEISTKFGDFEGMVTRDISSNKIRLENSVSELSSLIKAANILNSTGNLHKQKLERKCRDLKMAEDEVDLLGDEVDKLLDLLEKIYIALDHYSPVLQHYPGVIEILELVRRELSGESLKAH
uniref:WPP domain-associated protein n=1 Tax=Erigeron canadensis TaxID=72917 RepID=UPI001CB9B8DF|nr:WPP domain-associated protein [Erigeron canadensis]